MRRFVSTLLAFSMCLSMLQMSAFAEDAQLASDSDAVEVVEIQEQLEESVICEEEMPVVEQEEQPSEEEETPVQEETSEVEEGEKHEEQASNADVDMTDENELVESENTELPELIEEVVEEVADVLLEQPEAVVEEVENPDAEEETEDTALEQNVTVGSYTYTVENGTAYIYKYNGSASSVTLPTSAYINGMNYTISKVGSSAFANNTYLRSVTIPSTYTILGNCAFKNCTNLSSITINGNLGDCSYISSYRGSSENYSVFYNAGTNTSGMTVVFGSSVTKVPEYLFATGEVKSSNVYAHIKTVDMSNSGIVTIGAYAFYDCYDLTTVKMSNTTTSINGYAFKNCEKLQSFTFSSKLSSIGAHAFEECLSLNSITLPKSLTQLGNCAFKNCTNLSSVTINGNLGDCSYISSYRGSSENYSVFYNTGTNTSGMTVVFGSSVTKVPEYLFATGEDKSYNVYAHVKTVTIPASVKTIGEYAFYDCYDLANVKYGGFKSAWSGIDIGRENDPLIKAKRSYAQPTLANAKTGISVKWTAVKSADNYRVLRKTASETSWKKLTDTTSTSFVDKTAEAGVKYSYKLSVTVGTKTYESDSASILRNPFTDVTSKDGCFTPVMWAFNNKITTGTSDTTFSPNDNCTRGQFATMLYRLAGKPDVSKMKAPVFTDVKSTDSCYKAVVWAYNKGIISGVKQSNGSVKFMPYDNVTRYQLVLMMWKMAGSPAPKTPLTSIGTVFKDANKIPNNNAKKAALWANEKGITTANPFNPNDNCTRGQLAIFLYRFNRLKGYIK